MRGFLREKLSLPVIMDMSLRMARTRPYPPALHLIGLEQRVAGSEGAVGMSRDHPGKDALEMIADPLGEIR